MSPFRRNGRKKRLKYAKMVFLRVCRQKGALSRESTRRLVRAFYATPVSCSRLQKRRKPILFSRRRKVENRWEFGGSRCRKWATKRARTSRVGWRALSTDSIASIAICHLPFRVPPPNCNARLEYLFAEYTLSAPSFPILSGPVSTIRITARQ